MRMSNPTPRGYGAYVRQAAALPDAGPPLPPSQYREQQDIVQGARRLVMRVRSRRRRASIVAQMARAVPGWVKVLLPFAGVYALLAMDAYADVQQAQQVAPAPAGQGGLYGAG